MTIDTLVTEVTANGDGVATVFSFSPVTIAASTHLQVARIDASGNEFPLTQGVHYTVNIPAAMYPATGSISYPLSGTPLPADESIRMRRATPLFQPSDFGTQEAYDPETIERTFDTSRRIDQELARRIALVETAIEGVETIPVPGASAAQNVSYNSAGDLIFSSNNVQDALEEADSYLFGLTQALDTKANKSVIISTAAPLHGGGDLSGSPATIGLDTVAGSPASAALAAITRDEYGRVTSIANSAVALATSSPLTGGGTLAAGLTIGLDTLAGVAGSYTSANVTVDSFGRVTAAANGSSGGGLEWINVKDYGAVGDGSTDDTTAFNNALAAVPSTHGVFYVPAGRYRLTAQLSKTFGDIQDIAFIGDGADVSILEWNSGQGMALTLSLNERNDTTKLVVRDLAFTTQGTASGTALSVNGGGFTAGLTPRGPDFVNLNIRGAGQTHSWDKGIDCNDVPTSSFINITWLGAVNDKRGVGIIIRGTNSPADHYVYGCRFAWFSKCVLIQGDVEGVTITSCTGVAGARGVSWETTASEPFLSVTSCHFNTYEYGILADKAVQSFISGNLIYQDGTGSPQSWQGIGLNNSDHTVVFGNVIHGWNHTSTARNGIVVGGTCTHALVFGNVIRGFSSGHKIDTPVWIASGAAKSYAFGNSIFECSNAVIVDNATSAASVAAARGALVYRSSDYSAVGLIPFQAADYDTDGLWNNDTRLTVPANVAKVRLHAGVRIADGSAANTCNIVIQKNGSGAYTGRAAALPYCPAGVGSTTLSTAVLRVSQGDYFELFVAYDGSGANAKGGQTWFQMEIIA